MWWFKKAGARRAEIRRNRPDTTVKQVRALLSEGVASQIWIALAFAVGASVILCLHEVVPSYRAGQWTPSDIVARVDFTWRDQAQLEAVRQAKRQEVPHVYRPASPDPLIDLQQ